MYRIILLLLLSLAAMQCKEEPQPEVNQPALLPPATKSGKYTFGCLVNGKAWIAETSMDMKAIYQGGFLQISAGIEEKDRENSLKMVIANQPVEEKTYPFSSALPLSANASFIDYTSEICYYDFENLLDGTLTITNFDTQNYIVSGTFSFTTALEGCDTVRVTDGRFDMHYSP